MKIQHTIKRRLPTVLASILLWGSLTTTAFAALLIDTGPGPAAPNSWWSLQSDVTGGSPGSGQWLAASFDLNNDYFITDIAGWMITDGQTGNTFTISVYADGGGVPDPTNLLYSNQATVTGTGQTNWEGYHIGFGNGLPLFAGTYWLGFEVRPGNTYAGGMPSPSVSPLLNEAFNPSGTWLDFDGLDIGVRISGDLLTQVPLPAAAPLFASVIGLMGLAARKRKRQALALTA